VIVGQQFDGSSQPTLDRREKLTTLK